VSPEDKTVSGQDEKSKDVTDFLPQEEILAQLAEEAAELSQAALKLRRAMDGTNPTPASRDAAMKHLEEEIADVTLCIDLIGHVDFGNVNKIRDEKMNRWVSRLQEAREKP
jgi:NTP pyrophosphatase (non-canonical NTP hydrolase)